MNFNEILNSLPDVAEGQIAGSTYLIRAFWGNRITTGQILREMRSDFQHRISSNPAEEAGLKREYDKLEFMVKEAGFRTGYQFGPDVDISSDEVQHNHALYTAALIARSAEGRGWLDNSRRQPVIDELIVSSVVSRPEFAQETVELLEREEISIGRMTSHVSACASTGIAIANLLTLMRPGERGMYAGANSLSGGKWTHPSQYPIRAIFHNAGGAVAIEKEDANIFLYNVVIKHDARGAIRLPKFMHGVPPSTAAQPDYIREIDCPPEEISFSEMGFVKSIPTLRGEAIEKIDGLDDEVAFMHGVWTGSGFRDLAVPGMSFTFGNYVEQGYEIIYGPLKPGVMHPPSRIVARQIVRKYNRQERKRAAAGGKKLPFIHLGWSPVRGRDMRNSSDVTTIDYILGRLAQGELRPSEPIPGVFLGVGNVAAFWVAVWNQPK